mmetsp:Transcript_13039/g.37559  ORF Transcript_13039/g.37559 Transcript_13039/m.37559 type:complete len:83 (-) Transcript_13039:292-540(-)
MSDDIGGGPPPGRRAADWPPGPEGESGAPAAAARDEGPARLPDAQLPLVMGLHDLSTLQPPPADSRLNFIRGASGRWRTASP